VYEKYGEEKEDFIDFVNEKIKEGKNIVNIPKCL
jgi:hypothetical protein